MHLDGTFFTLNEDPNRPFWTTYPPNLVYEVIERPLISNNYQWVIDILIDSVVDLILRWGNQSIDPWQEHNSGNWLKLPNFYWLNELSDFPTEGLKSQKTAIFCRTFRGWVEVFMTRKWKCVVCGKSAWPIEQQCRTTRCNGCGDFRLSLQNCWLITCSSLIRWFHKSKLINCIKLKLKQLKFYCPAPRPK